ncbi:MAG: hypothetical protein IT306_06485 [Chloroflexi bacterium]|nr:hypothetical protein [Chloroflexota bacterium]
MAMPRPILRSRPPRPGFSAREPFPMPERMQQNLLRMYAEIAEPFVGITTDGAARPDLFHIGQTGISTASILDATRRPMRRSCTACNIHCHPERSERPHPLTRALTVSG